VTEYLYLLNDYDVLKEEPAQQPFLHSADVHKVTYITNNEITTYIDNAMVLLHKLAHYNDILSLFALNAQNFSLFNEVSECIHPLVYLLFAYSILKKSQLYSFNAHDTHYK
jgi:hypothetical protein